LEVICFKESITMVKNKIAILLADIDAISAAAETAKLENCGYAVVTADTPEKTVKSIENISGIDLILMTSDFANLNGIPPAALSILKNNMTIKFAQNFIAKYL
ncbi:MAG TPA: hypothetical protein PKL57_00805, partial [Candidatus Wallbacteria bacterium]|nr:hypothetical protein [Candidatus Wallbacteria bacterium]